MSVTLTLNISVTIGSSIVSLCYVLIIIEMQKSECSEYFNSVISFSKE